MIIILDSGPIIKGNLQFDYQNDLLFTVPQVILEIRDEKSRENLKNLNLEIINPRPECIQEILKFAKNSGDFASLSKTDIRVLALTLQKEQEFGSNSIKTEFTTRISHGEKKKIEEGEWITPENIGSIIEPRESETVKVACITTDFAMQNILLQMKLNLISVDKISISKIKNWVLRCHACFKITRDNNKVFCPCCGNNTLIRTSYSIGKDGDLILYLKKNFQYNNRGSKFSIPAPKSGQNSQDMILREDQKEYHRALKNYQRQSKISDPFDLDFMPLDNISKQTLGQPRIGHGRRNINQREMQKIKFLSKEERAKLVFEKTPLAKTVEPSVKRHLPSEWKEAELQGLQKRYMGIQDKQPKKIRKATDKKFVFDWAEEEDTSQQTVEYKSSILGRSWIGGLDPNSQAQERSIIYKKALKDRKDSSFTVALKSKEDERHWSLKDLEEMNLRDWRILREDYEISVKGKDLPNPLRSWEESKIPEKILKVIKSIGYKEPTPIQRAAIPIGLQNRDLIGIAETGSGKTASFVIPMLSFISNLPILNDSNYHLGPYGLILAPTRELAQQIELETNKFAKGLNFIAVSLVGGHSIGEQAFNLRDGAHIVMGRLVDMLDRRVLVLNQCSTIVLDEADRMIDLGFEEDMNFILEKLAASKSTSYSRQMVMFSATMPPPLERLARKFLDKPAIINVGTVGKAVDTIHQIVEMMADDNFKRSRLSKILSSGEYNAPIIIFVNRKANCDIIFKVVEKLGYRAATLHGGKSQDQRESALFSVKSGKKDILIATDVAGRGIDIKNVSLVLNYDMAKNIEDYTHRIGRTGRAGKKGTAITFLTMEDSETFYDLKQALLKSTNSVIPPELSRHEAAQSRSGTGKAII